MGNTVTTFLFSPQICSQLSERLESQQKAAREELLRIKVSATFVVHAACLRARLTGKNALFQSAGFWTVGCVGSVRLWVKAKVEQGFDCSSSSMTVD